MGISNILWGITADRMGDRAVAQLSGVGMAAAAVAWVAAGDAGTAAHAIIMTAAFVRGMFQGGSMMSSIRVLLNHIPPRVSPVLLAIRNMATTAAAVVASAMGGLILKFLEGWNWSAPHSLVKMDGYKVLFLVSAVAYLATSMVGRRFPTMPGQTPWTVLAVMMNRPLQTAWIISRIDQPLAEDTRVNLIHKLARSANPLAHEGLVAGLKDPSYDVRLASVNALASRPGPQSFQALMDVIYLPELDIQPEAVGALGELGDQRAVPVLLGFLHSPSDLLRGRAARALGKLQVAQAVPALQRLLSEDHDSFVRRSAAIALSKLKVTDALEDILRQFQKAQTRLAQRELALALANLVYGGDLYYQLQHQQTQDLAGPLDEALEQALAPRSFNRQGQQYLRKMVNALRQRQSQQIMQMASKAVKLKILSHPCGLPGTLYDYLLSGIPAECWTDEHAALLIFLLLRAEYQQPPEGEHFSKDDQATA